jgi:hypothetical protein
MTPQDGSQLDAGETRMEKEPLASKLQLQLATSIVDTLIERNASRAVADEFWNDNSVDSLPDEGEYVDADLSDPDEETLPEMNEINWNIYPCN